MAGRRGACRKPGEGPAGQMVLAAVSHARAAGPRTRSRQGQQSSNAVIARARNAISDCRWRRCAAAGVEFAPD